MSELTCVDAGAELRVAVDDRPERTRDSLRFPDFPFVLLRESVSPL